MRHSITTLEPLVVDWEEQMEALRVEEVKTKVVRTKEGLDVDKEGNTKKMEKMELPECYEARVTERELGDCLATQIFSLMDTEGKIVSRCYFSWDETKKDWVKGEMDVFVDDKEDLMVPYKCSRFANKRWKVWWEKQVAERKEEIGLLRVMRDTETTLTEEEKAIEKKRRSKENRKHKRQQAEMIDKFKHVDTQVDQIDENRRRFLTHRQYVDIDFAGMVMRDLRRKGELYVLKRYKTSPRLIYEKTVRERYEELEAFRRASLDWSFAKWRHADREEETKKSVEFYNSSEFFAVRKEQTRSPIPLERELDSTDCTWVYTEEDGWYKMFREAPIPQRKVQLRWYGSFFNKQSSMPYSVQDRLGKPASGDKQTWVDKGYTRVSGNVRAKIQTRQEYLKLLKEHEDKLLKADSQSEELGFIQEQFHGIV